MNLDLTAPQPGSDGIIRIMEMTAPELYVKKRARTINDLSSLIAYIKKWGNPAKGTIYWTPAGVVAVMDEEDLLSGNGSQDKVAFSFNRPYVARTWLDAIGRSFSHKGFKTFLESRWQEMAEGPDLFAKISNLSLAQTFKYDAKLQDDQTYQIAFASEAGGDVATLPKVVTVTIPLLEGLEKPYRLVLKLKLTVPDGEKATPSFEFTWEDQEAVIEQAARDAIAYVQEQLPDWLVVHGKP
jgi:uncharacterized protein YfdQ (DUF2303 family)